MELQYRILGADGQEYGPATLSELQTWINQGRIHSGTQVWRTDQSAWRSASEFSEFLWPQASPAQSAPPPTQTFTAPASEAETALDAKAKSGAGWFFWIAALTGVNTISILSGGDWAFFLGMAVTQVIDVFAKSAGGAGMAVAVALDLFVVGIFVLLGIFARKHHGWAFITGMVLYGLDSVLSFLGEDWLAFGFHLFVVFCIFGGYKASREFKSIRQ